MPYLAKHGFVYRLNQHHQHRDWSLDDLAAQLSESHPIITRREDILDWLEERSFPNAAQLMRLTEKLTFHNPFISGGRQLAAAPHVRRGATAARMSDQPDSGQSFFEHYPRFKGIIEHFCTEHNWNYDQLAAQLFFRTETITLEGLEEIMQGRGSPVTLEESVSILCALERMNMLNAEETQHLISGVHQEQHVRKHAQWQPYLGQDRVDNNYTPAPPVPLKPEYVGALEALNAERGSPAKTPWIVATHANTKCGNDVIEAAVDLWRLLGNPPHRQVLEAQSAVADSTVRTGLGDLAAGRNYIHPGFETALMQFYNKDGTRTPQQMERLSEAILRYNTMMKALWHSIGFNPQGPYISFAGRGDAVAIG